MTRTDGSEASSVAHLGGTTVRTTGPDCGDGIRHGALANDKRKHCSSLADSAHGTQPDVLGAPMEALQPIGRRARGAIGCQSRGVDKLVPVAHRWRRTTTSFAERLAGLHSSTSTRPKPSRSAASFNRASSETNGSDDGRPSDATSAAANWSASAARKSWDWIRRMAVSRTSAVGSINAQAGTRAASLARASIRSAASISPERSRRAIAETHSTGVAHQTPIRGSFASRRCNARVVGSSIKRGTIAELSQCLNGPPCALRAALPQPGLAGLTWGEGSG